jgi:hypothetical protein
LGENVVPTNITFAQATGVFTVGLSRKYVINFQAVYNLDGTADPPIRLRVRVNGTQQWTAVRQTESGFNPDPFGGEVVLDLAANDTVAVTIECEGTNNITVNQGTTVNIYSIIGPQGPIGATGQTGPVGATGDVGPTGPPGVLSDTIASVTRSDTKSSTLPSSEFNILAKNGPDSTENVVPTNITFTQATGEFTVQASQKYVINFQAVYDLSGTSDTITVRVRVNGTEQWAATRQTESGFDPDPFGGEVILSLAANDIVAVTIQCANTSNSIVVNPGTTVNLYSIIGPQGPVGAVGPTGDLGDLADVTLAITASSHGQALVYDQATPGTWRNDTIVWKDLIGNITYRSGNSNKPPLIAAYLGNITLYQLRTNDVTRLSFAYHIPHDWLNGQTCYFHLHYTHNDPSLAATNLVTFNLEMTAARLSATPTTHTFVTPTRTVTGVVMPLTGTRYEHQIAEVEIGNATGANSPNGATINTTTELDIDSVWLIDCEVSTVAQAGVENITSLFAIQGDIHYQSTNLGTFSRLSPFSS